MSKFESFTYRKFDTVQDVRSTNENVFGTIVSVGIQYGECPVYHVLWNYKDDRTDTQTFIGDEYLKPYVNTRLLMTELSQQEASLQGKAGFGPAQDLKYIEDIRNSVTMLFNL